MSVSRGRPIFRLDVLAQGAAFVALLVVFILLMAQLRDEAPRRPPSPVAPVTTDGQGPTPGQLTPILAPPPPLAEGGSAGSNKGVRRPTSGAGGPDADGAIRNRSIDVNPEKPVKPRFFVFDGRGRRIPGANVHAKTR